MAHEEVVRGPLVPRLVGRLHGLLEALRRHSLTPGCQHLARLEVPQQHVLGGDLRVDAASFGEMTMSLAAEQLADLGNNLAG